MTHITCRLNAKNRDHLRNPTLGNRVWATVTFSHALAATEVTETGEAYRFAVDDGAGDTDLCFVLSAAGSPQIPRHDARGRFRADGHST